MTRKRIVEVSVGVVCIALTAVVAWHFGAARTMARLTANMMQIREGETGYRYIQPLLACDTLRDFESTSYASLKTAFEEVIAAQKEQEHAQDIGVYFRNLQNGQWTAVNGDMPFTGASLFKVPNMMAIFRQEDVDHDMLAQTYTVDPDEIPTLTQDVPPTHALQDGETYTVDDLVRYMIVYSDNRANHALDLFGDGEMLASVYKDFGVELGRDADGAYTITPRDYGYFFRGLYNATYLSRMLSEKALGYLAQTEFTDGLRAGVPASVPIAHKFGNATITTEDGTVTQEIHDCGIVYGPAAPYFLCVMTRGSDIAALESVVEAVSAAAYDKTQR